MTAPETVAYWDAQADSFDEEPDHGLRDPLVREAWLSRLVRWLPAAGVAGTPRVLDIGCGTGTLAALLSAHGFAVTGADLSLAMLERARAKGAEVDTSLPVLRMDASRPAFRDGTFDAVLSRHLVWTLGPVDEALARWAELLRPAGRLVLIEGQWDTGDGATRTGIPAAELEAVAARYFASVTVEHLQDAALWGRAIDDERYALVARDRR